MNITFIQGFKPLVKKFTPDGVEHFPLVKRVTSTEYEIPCDEDGMKQLIQLYRKHANDGFAVMKGPFKQALVKESRAGQTLTKANTQNIVLDFDGIAHPNADGALTRERLTALARFLVSMLPECFAEANCIVHPSSSMGMKPGKISMHLEFFLDVSIDPRTLKNILRYINLRSTELIKNIGITASGTALTWPIDLCLADNSRVIYIGTPHFIGGVKNPILDQDRFFMLAGVGGSKATVSTKDLINWFDEREMGRLHRETLRAVQLTHGITIQKEKVRRLTIDGFSHSVVINPAQVEMTVDREYEHYVTYNINNGDSHAYYVLKSNPSVVFNWKGEPPFLFQQANEEAYQQHIEEYAITGDGTVIPVAFRDQATDQHYAGLYYPADQRIEECYAIARNNIDPFFVSYGGIAPDPLPQVNYIFTPQLTTIVDWKQRIVNRWREPELMTAPFEDDNMQKPVEETFDTLPTLCPTIYKIIDSVTGNGRQEAIRFINWLAFIVQRREKAKTAWLFQGVEGTGKGVLFAQILKPIFGQYAVEKPMINLEEQYNQWLETAMILAIDEFKVERNNRGDAFYNRLKNLITEDEVTIREMRANQKLVKNYTNVMAFTNNNDAAPFSASDRRWNVCPAQRIPLIARYPTIRDDILHKLPGEVKVFAGYLCQVEVHVGDVYSVINNEAKEQMRASAMTTVESFVNMFLAGRANEFDLIAEMDMGMVDDTTALITAQQEMGAWIRDIQAVEAETGQPVEKYVAHIDRKTMLAFYRVLVGQYDSPNKAYKALAHYGMYSIKTRHKRHKTVTNLYEAFLNRPAEGWEALADRWIPETPANNVVKLNKG